MKTKSRQTVKRHRSRAHRSRAHRSRAHRSRVCRLTGGMFRGSASAMGKKVFSEVFGKGFDRLEKAKQVGERVASDMMTHLKTPKKFNYVKSATQFRFDSPLRTELHRHSSQDRAYNAAIHTTPNRRTHSTNSPPKLETRRRHRVDEELNSDPIVKELFTH